VSADHGHRRSLDVYRSGRDAGGDGTAGLSDHYASPVRDAFGHHAGSVGFGVWPPDGVVPGGLQELLSQPFPVPLDQDGARVYESQVEINGERADIELPDGQHQIVIDPRIADWAGSFATFEAYSDNGLTDSRVGFTEIWAQSSRVQ
jgi:hypothetical protein